VFDRGYAGCRSYPLRLWAESRTTCFRAKWCYTIVTDNGYYKGGNIYVRRVKSRGSGPYFQLVRSYRNEEGQPRQEVLVHLGVHETPEAALSAWPQELAHLRRIGRDQQADKLEANLRKLTALTEAQKRKDE
jgi:hypothetical protein